MQNQMDMYSEMVGGEQQGKMVPRETPEISPERKALVTRWHKIVKAGKDFRKDRYERMRECMTYAHRGAGKDWTRDKKYIANITQRHINQSVAQLYAKNPKAVAKRKPRLNFSLWDGKPESIQQAMMGMQQAQMMGMPPDMNAMQMLMEVQQAKSHMQMLDRLGKTQVILFNYYLDEQEPKFKTQMKQMVRRTKVCGVGYMELGFQRLMEPDADVTKKISDVSDQIAEMERILADVADGEIQPDSHEMAELQAMMEALQQKEFIIVREGPVFGFPRSTEIIVDPRCRQLQGFIGANWVAQEMLLTPDEVQRFYKVDIGSSYTTYQPDKRDYLLDPETVEDTAGKGMVCVWRVQDKRTGTVFTLADGYADFLQGPEAPPVKLERFWTTFVLTFNDIEDEDEMIPPSDVELMMDMQDEYNRSREALREHRKANRPKYITVAGRLDDEDKAKLMSHPDSAVIELNALAPGEKAEELLQAFKPAPIDPALYDTTPVFDDVQRSVGSQEANLGGTGGATATESSIAESGRVASLSSNVDDLDEFLSDVARSTGQLMLIELDTDTVFEIVGPGAVWPTLSREEIVKEIFLEIKAGSSGRPNRAGELANLERGMPFILQIPGMNPTPFGQRYLDLLDIDVEDAIIEGMPSITALNSMAGGQTGQATGDPATDPAMQGGDGADNAPRQAGDARDAQERGQNPNQPAFPSPVPGHNAQNQVA
jgi:hypothetical protein